MPHTLYFTAGSGNSFKPALVLRQTGRSCAMRPVDVVGGETRRPEFLTLNARGQVPYLVTEDGRGIAESNAIAWFLAGGTPLIPADPVDRARALQWMFFEQNSLEPNISPARFVTHIVPSLRDAHVADLPRWRKAGCQALQVLNQHLARNEFMIGGSYSVADIAVYGYTHLAEDGGFTLSEYPDVLRWMQSVQETPEFATIGQLLQP